MAKKLLAALIAACLLAPCAALAEVWQGTAEAGRTTVVTAETGGVLDWIGVEPGDAIGAGEVIGEIRTTKVYATQDGTVATLSIQAGDSADGTVLELAPVDPYAIYCTVDGAYDDPAAQLVHAGETVYVRCTVNGTHRAVGTVAMMEGNEYRVIPTGGELYVGEVVELYRDEACSDEQCVGVGTVVESDVETYSAQGTVTAVHVSAGEFVERGELLFEYVSGDSASLTAEEGGVVVSVAAEAGDSIESGASVVKIAPAEDICVEFRVAEEDAALISIGDRVTLVYAWDADERETGGTVCEISSLAEDGTFAVRVVPDEPLEWLGLTVEVRTDE